jgi:diadenosine tetraphosphate (Ap4A) HIT family hydrolase
MMVADTQWEQLVRGVNCPFEAPRTESNDEWDFVARLTASSLYLAKNQTYRGQCLLILDLRHATRLEELSRPEWLAFASDLYSAEKAVVDAVRPDHINVAALGNVVPHLHWHIVPRYAKDPRWGSPIWQTAAAGVADTRLASDEQLGLIRTLRRALASG